MKYSFLWWCFCDGRVQPDVLLREARTIGYQGVELAEPRYWAPIHNAGMEIVVIKAHESLTTGLNRCEHFPKLQTEILSNLAAAERWRIPNLLCFSGNRNGLDDVTGAEITAEHLRSLAPFAEAAGVTILLELLNSKIDHPDYQCDRTSWGVSVIEMVASPNVKLLFDIYHMQIMEGDVIRTIKDKFSYFGHYHTAGNPGRHDLDDDQELHYPGIMRAIAATGYTGYVGQEFIPKGDPISSLQHAFAVCTGY